MKTAIFDLNNSEDSVGILFMDLSPTVRMHLQHLRIAVGMLPPSPDGSLHTLCWWPVPVNESIRIFWESCLKAEAGEERLPAGWKDGDAYAVVDSVQDDVLTSLVDSAAEDVASLLEVQARPAGICISCVAGTEYSSTDGDAVDCHLP